MWYKKLFMGKKRKNKTKRKYKRNKTTKKKKQQKKINKKSNVTMKSFSYQKKQGFIKP